MYNIIVKSIKPPNVIKMIDLFKLFMTWHRMVISYQLSLTILFKLSIWSIISLLGIRNIIITFTI